MTANGQERPREIRFEALGADAPRSFRAFLPADLIHFDGHFPEFPLLPGVTQLASVVVPLARRAFPGLGAVQKLRRVRFRRPIGPDQTIVVTLSRAELRVAFEIAIEGEPREVASTGTVEFRSDAPDAPDAPGSP